MDEMNEKLAELGMGALISNLPDGWTLLLLMDVAELNPGLPEPISDETEVSFLPMKLVEEETGIIHPNESRIYKQVKKGFTPIINGDVIFAKISPCMENGKIAIVNKLKNDVGFGSTEFHVFRCSGALKRGYLFFYLIQSQFRQDAKNNMTGAVGQRRVPTRYLQGCSIPLPPLAEQERIVAKIEELFSSLDKGIESLKAAQAQLKVYRQAVLKHAFEGRLTNKDVKEGELPEGWKIITLMDVADVSGGITKNANREHFPKKYPYLRVANVYQNYLNLKRVENIGVQDGELDRCLLIRGDILFVEGNGSLDQIGRAAIWSGEITNCVHQNHIIKARPRPSVLGKFILYYFCSRKGRDSIKEIASSTSGLYTLSISKIAGLLLPICKPSEQEAIILEIESRLSVADKLEESIAQSLEQAEALRQSILKKAFEGKLVPQGPNDEPASVLLERIRKERAVSGTKAPRIKNGRSRPNKEPAPEPRTGKRGRPRSRPMSETQ